MTMRPSQPVVFCGLAFALAGGCALDDRGMTYLVGSNLGSSTNANGGRPNSSNKGGEPGSKEAGASSGDAGNDTGAGGEEPGAGGASPNGGSSAGSENNGGALAGSSGSAQGGAGTGGGGKGGTAGEPFVSPCGDLNENRRDDCEETLVQNSRFDSAVSSWEADQSVQQLWAPTNATSATGSGSLSVSNTNVVASAAGNTAVGSRQCLLGWGKETFEVAARVFIKASQGSGKGSLNIAFYGHDKCSGGFLEGQTIATVDTVGAWTIARGTVKLPAATRSISLRLLASKPLSQPAFEVLFDDVLVVKE